MNQILPDSDNDNNFEVIFAGISLKLEKKKRQNVFKFLIHVQFFFLNIRNERRCDRKYVSMHKNI